MPAIVTWAVMRPSAARDAAAAAADVVVVHRARQHDVGVGVEAARELLAVVLEVRLDRVLPALERMLVVLVAAVEPLRELELGAVADLPDPARQRRARATVLRRAS